MDYEKKYNEALERAKNLMEQVRNNELLGFPDQFTEIFPELREDEDERVRKVIVKYFKGLHEQSWINLEIPDILAYLEKQKEQKPAEKQDYSGLNDLERAIHRGFLCAGVENVPVTIIKDTAAECMGFLALIEPKPAKWSEEDEKMLNDIIGTIAYAWGETSDRVSWLKSLRPSWKPSEEQMDALKELIDDANRAGWVTPGATELYEQLKKL